MSSIIDNAYINFHNLSNADFPIVESNFGILQLKIAETNIIKTPIAVLFDIDCSASMTDPCSDNRTKIQNIIHTLTRILSEFAKAEEATIYVAVIAFNDKIHRIFDFIQVTKENVNDLIKKINEIEAEDSTNIEIALKESREIIETYKKSNPLCKMYHIQLTDGEIRDGETNLLKLKEMIDDSYTNIFVGFGLEHDSFLLNGLSNIKKGDYRFIDKIENSGLVYGEIIHNILYSAIENTKIIVENGKIYDWTKNTWENEIEFSGVSGNSEKTFHVKTATPNDIVANIYGSIHNSDEIILLDTIIRLPELIYLDTNMIEPEDLTKYAFRQKTLELLFNVRNYTEQKYKLNHTSLLNPDNDEEEYDNLLNNKQVLKAMAKELALKLRKLMKEMRNYMKNNHLETDKFMKLLCDDICVAYNTFESPYAQMYVSSRQSSQGRQQTYTSTPIRNMSSSPRDCPGAPCRLRKIRRASTNSFSTIAYNDILNEDVMLSSIEMDDSMIERRLSDDPFNDYTISDDSMVSAPYSTPEVLRLMRDFSK
jgi:uncharacterized protein YegL